MEKGLKICVLGAGNVGATIAYTLTLDGMASEIVIIDINEDKARGEALDIIQGTPFCSPVNIHAGDYSDAAGSDIVIVTVGMGRKPGMTRIDLAQNNVNIIKSTIPSLVKHAPDAVYIVVSNPVDILTYVITKISGLPQNRVIGSGTLLDSARLRTGIAQQIGISPTNVHGYVFGEHGDTSMVPWSLISIGGMEINAFCESVGLPKEYYDKEALTRIEEDMRNGGAKVIGFKGATFYAVSLTVRRICDNIVRNVGALSTVSSMMTGQYGLQDVCLSLPFVIGAEGIERCVTPPLTPEEEQKLHQSAAALLEAKKSLDI